MSTISPPILILLVEMQLTVKFEIFKRSFIFQKITCSHLGGKSWLEEFKSFIQSSVNATATSTHKSRLDLSLKNTSIRDIKTPLNLAGHEEIVSSLKLENDDVRSIADDAFSRSDAQDLKILSLRQNSLNFLPISFFQHFSELEDLDISHNHFQNLTTAALNSEKSSKLFFIDFLKHIIIILGFEPTTT